MFETNATIIGTVLSEPNVRTVGPGSRVCDFRMVAQERRYDRDRGEWVDGDRIWAQVTCWRKLADGVSASVAKGDHVIATGRLYVEEYEAEGQRRSVVKLEARSVGPDLARCVADVRRADHLAEVLPLPVAV